MVEIKYANLLHLVMAAYLHEEITTSKGKNLLKMGSIQEFRLEYIRWVKENVE